MGRLRYTGNPFIDGGIALATVFSGVEQPEDVNDDHLRRLAQQIRDWRSNQLYRNKVLSIAFTRNGAFTNSAKEEKRQLAIAELLDSWQEDITPTADEDVCTFFPEYRAVLSADRRHIPMMTGDNIINFTPRGQGGVPVCGLALLILSALPFATYQISGRLLLFHQLGVDTRFNTVITEMIYRHNQNQWMLTESSLDGHWETPHPYAQTAYIDTLINARRYATANGYHVYLADITAYYFSNSGQNPTIEILQLDNSILGFIDVVSRRAMDSWNFVVQQGWQRPPDDPKGRGKNKVHQLLFQMPNELDELLRFMMKSRDWLIVSLYLEKVLNMETHHIDLLREVGDRLTDYALEYESSPTAFYHRIARCKSFDDMRRILRSAGERYLKQATHTTPLITFDEMTLLFFSDVPYITWKVTRDLLTFRMLERLTTTGQLDLDQLNEDDPTLNETTES